MRKKGAEKSGDLIIKKFSSRFNKSKTTKRPNIPVKQEESVDIVSNRLISGPGIKKDEKVRKLII